MKNFLRILIGVLATFFAINLIATGVGEIVEGKDFFAWAAPLGLGVPMLFGGLGLIFNWFDEDDFLYWPF